MGGRQWKPDRKQPEGEQENTPSDIETVESTGQDQYYEGISGDELPDEENAEAIENGKNEVKPSAFYWSPGMHTESEDELSGEGETEPEANAEMPAGGTPTAVSTKESAVGQQESINTHGTGTPSFENEQGADQESETVPGTDAGQDDGSVQDGEESEASKDSQPLSEDVNSTPAEEGEAGTSEAEPASAIETEQTSESSAQDAESGEENASLEVEDGFEDNAETESEKEAAAEQVQEEHTQEEMSGEERGTETTAELAAEETPTQPAVQQPQFLADLMSTAPGNLLFHKGMYFGTVLPDVAKRYTYCPTIIKEGSRYNIWYCTNKYDGSKPAHLQHFNDVIGYRQVEPSPEGFAFSIEYIALDSSPSGAWDSYHVCDPSVIRGEFIFNGQSYQYLMAYLGNSDDSVINHNSNDNEIGLAVSNSPNSGWIRVGRIVGSNTGGNSWGAGQPSLLSLDGKSRVGLVYTNNDGAQSVMVMVIDGTKLGGECVADTYALTEKGAISRLHNADFAYSSDGYLYAVGDDVAYSGDASAIGFVSFRVNLYRAYIGEGNLEAGLRKLSTSSPEVSWEYLGSLGHFDQVHESNLGRASGWNEENMQAYFARLTNVSPTGFIRNHNAALVRDAWGRLAERSVVVTVGPDTAD